jgi:hypothetical protein
MTTTTRSNWMLYGAFRKRAIASATRLVPNADSPRMRFAAASLAGLLAVQRSTGADFALLVPGTRIQEL